MEKLVEVRSEADKVIYMTLDAWWDKFHPLKNTVTGREELNHCGFETFGKDLEHVRNLAATTPYNVWTVYDTMTVGEGFHLVNRLMYLITRMPAEEGWSYVILPRFADLNIRDYELAEAISYEIGAEDRDAMEETILDMDSTRIAELASEHLFLDLQFNEDIQAFQLVAS